MMQRRTVLALSAALLSACAAREFKPLEFKPDVVLQDAPPGKAIIYLIRAPHDHGTFPVFFNARLMASLPSSTYTVVVVDPGTYAVASSPNGKAEWGPASQLTVQAGERRFLYVSAPSETTFDMKMTRLGKLGMVPLLLPTTSAVGAHTWQECTELDAQGLMSIAKLVMPAPGAL
jgi:hypothetical protein